VAGLDDEDGSDLLLLAGLLTFGVAPRAEEVLTTTTGLGLTFTTAVRVVNRVHGHTADGRTNALPAGAACFAGNFVHVIAVTDLADGCVAGFVEAADFAGRHLDQCPAAFAVGKDSELACGASHFATTTRNEFDVVDVGAEWHVTEWHRVAGFWSDFFAGDDGGTDFQADGGEDVGLLSVFVLDQSDAASAVWIVFDADHGGCDSVFAAFEVDKTVVALVTTADVAGGDTTGVVTTAGALEWCEEALLWLAFSNFLESRKLLVAAGWSDGLESFKGHDSRNG
jgi:hypothetical protein